MKLIRQNGGTQEDVKREAEEFIRIIQEDKSADESKFIILIDDFTEPCFERYNNLIEDSNKHRIKVVNCDTIKDIL